MNRLLSTTSRIPPGQTNLASAVPLLIFSILFGVAIGATTFSSKTQIEHWQHAVFGLPYGQIAFAAYCAMSRRPGRRNAVILSFVAVLIWNAVTFILLVQVQTNLFLSFSHTIALYRYQLFVRTNTEFLAIVVWMIVTSTYVLRSFWFEPKSRLTLKRVFAIVTSAAVILALRATHPDTSNLAAEFRFHLPHFPLYFLVVGAAQARRFSAVLGIAAIMLSGACGFLIAYSEISPWTTAVELSIYSCTLFTSLMTLRVADFYARAPGADASGSSEMVTAIAD